LSIIEKLGVQGMSSEEETEVEFEAEPMKAYKVKICIWRNPEIVGYVQLVDKQTDALCEQTVKSGVYPARRLRSTNEIGTSGAPKGLPDCLYNADWLNRLGIFDREDLEVSEEEFAL
ncbi:hypothetical protein B0H13DRAFT_1582050, partial [Mycena leptocephala]